MDSRLDCLVIGYNDVPFPQHEQRVINRAKTSPERRIFMREHLLFEGRREPYMETINSLLRHAGRLGPDQYLHLGEVPNLAAYYLANYLITRGFAAECTSLFRAESERIAYLLETRNPRSVAITTTYYIMPWPVIEISRFIRAHAPDTKIIVGGPLVANLLSDLEPSALNEMFAWMNADVYVQESQGEQTLARIIKMLRSDADLSAVPNLHIPDSSGGGYVYTGPEPEANVMDECIINWELFTERLGPTVHTRTARSCAYKCSFCDYPIRAGELSLASVDVVEQELRQLADLGVEHVVFIDDTFNIPGPRFKDMCRMMVRNKYDFHWYSFFRAASARDVETYDLMAESGCGAVFLGIEAGDDAILRNMSKVATIERYRFGVDRLKERGITTFASFISGFPGETEVTIRGTIDFINEACPTFYRSEPWWYNHRSPIHRQADQYGITGKGYEWTHRTMDINGACDGVDALFGAAKTSIWLPGYNFDFWAVPYLLGKGITMPEVMQFASLAQEVMRFNDRADAQVDGSVVNAMWHVFEDGSPIIGGYRTSSAAMGPESVY